MKIRLFLIFFIWIQSGRLNAQSFQNPDLDGIISGTTSYPYLWQNVPATDINCKAIILGFHDTPNLTDTSGPSKSTGIYGIPYSGPTFVCGLDADRFHEGIMQTVQGFIPQVKYSIQFYQCVVKQVNALDKSGSWAVYADDSLVGITTPTYSNDPYDSKYLKWEFRKITFTAFSNSHTIKFLPLDDDNNIIASTTDTLGGLRMGIDKLNLVSNVNKTIQIHDTTLCEGDTFFVELSIPNATYLWNDNSTSPVKNITKQGVYWVESTAGSSTFIDTFIVNFSVSPSVDLGRDKTICKGEIVELHAFTSNATYLWQDGSIKPKLNVSEEGKYWVQVSIGKCINSDTINIKIDDCISAIEIPNVFTPNGDGFNDNFEIVINDSIDRTTFLIYNRWGQKLYENVSLNPSWNGKYNGNKCAGGTYFWMLQYWSNGEKKQANGTVMLIR